MFDSGIGGKSVANAIQKACPNDEIIFVNDAKNVPYGSKTLEELWQLVAPIMDDLAHTADVIVVACNTVMTLLMDRLRENFEVPFVGIEPMIKPAARQTKSKAIIVCATPATLSSKRYRSLVDEYANGVTVAEPDCSRWAYCIERNNITKHMIKESLEPDLRQGADVVVLACTHYHWIEAEITELAHQYEAVVMQPEKAIIKQVKTVLERLA